MKKRILYAVSAALSVLMISKADNVRAQDIHFTQFSNCVQQYNPALTGQFEQMLKGTLLHRRQWRTIGTGYVTSGVDAQYKLLGLYNDNYTGFGLLVLQDDAGFANMKQLLVKGAASYHLVASDKDLISAGMQLGYEQRTVNFDDLKWDSQYNGINYDPTLDDKERFITNRRGFVDIGAGFHWKHRSKRKFNLGYAVFHSGQQITMVARGNDKYKLRQVLHGTWMKRYEHIDMKYDFLIQRQAGAQAVILGAECGYRIGQDSKYTNVRTSSLAKAGVFWRAKDAIQPFIGFEYKRSYAITIGYDIRTAKMPGVMGRPGGPEIALTYLGSIGRSRMKVVH